MISPKWPIILLVVMIGLSFISGIVEGIYLGSGEASTMSTLVGTGVPIGERLSAFWAIVSFDYPMYVNEYVIIRYIFASIGVGVLLVIVLTVVSNIASFASRFFTGGI